MSRALKAERYPYVLHKRISRGRNKTDGTERRQRYAAACSSAGLSLIGRDRPSRRRNEIGDVRTLTMNQSNFLHSDQIYL